MQPATNFLYNTDDCTIFYEQLSIADCQSISTTAY